MDKQSIALGVDLQKWIFTPHPSLSHSNTSSQISVMDEFGHYNFAPTNKSSSSLTQKRRQKRCLTIKRLTPLYTIHAGNVEKRTQYDFRAQQVWWWWCTLLRSCFPVPRYPQLLIRSQINLGIGKPLWQWWWCYHFSVPVGISTRPVVWRHLGRPRDGFLSP